MYRISFHLAMVLLMAAGFFATEHFAELPDRTGASAQQSLHGELRRGLQPGPLRSVKALDVTIDRGVLREHGRLDFKHCAGIEKLPNQAQQRRPLLERFQRG